MDKKYELVESDKALIRYRSSSYHTLYRVKYLKDIPKYGVKAGQMGGYVNGEHNLDQEGDCCVLDNAMVLDDAVVRGNAVIKDSARVRGHADVFGNATIRDNAGVVGYAVVFDNATVQDSACVKDNATVKGNCVIKGDVSVGCDATVFDNATIQDNVRVTGRAMVFDNATIRDNADITTDAVVRGNATITMNARITGDCIVSGNAVVEGGAELTGDLRVSNNAHIGGPKDYYKISTGNIALNAAIESDCDLLVIGPIGSRYAYTTFYKSSDNQIYVTCGCFNDTLENFEREVNAVHGCSEYGDRYREAIEAAKRMIKIK